MTARPAAPSATTGRAPAARPPTARPARPTYLLDDGDALTFGWRVVNLSDNAANIGYTTESIDDTSWTDRSNLDLVSTAPDYETFDGLATGLFVCPAYVYWCDAPDKLTDDAATSAMDKCTHGDASWLLGTVSGSRIADSTLTTTFYIINLSRELSGDAMSLTGPKVTIVIAADNLSD